MKQKIKSRMALTRSAGPEEIGYEDGLANAQKPRKSVAVCELMAWLAGWRRGQRERRKAFRAEGEAAAGQDAGQGRNFSNYGDLIAWQEGYARGHRKEIGK